LEEIIRKRVIPEEEEGQRLTKVSDEAYTQHNSEVNQYEEIDEENEQEY
jgi:hypothetical protein